MEEEGGFDPCECVYNSHQAAMRRLMALLRSSQSYCTDSECFDELPGPSSDSESNLFLMTFLALAVGFFLIMFRPGAVRDSGEPSKARRDNEPDDSAPPPIV